jgi:hypothetical protein
MRVRLLATIATDATPTAAATTVHGGIVPAVRRLATARLAWLDATAPSDWCERTEPRDWWDASDPSDIAEPMESAEPNDPTLPTDRTEPTLPIDSTEPRDHSERTESVEPIDQPAMGPTLADSGRVGGSP